MERKYLMYVDGSDDTNNNKYYEMIPDSGNTKFTVKFGRVGAKAQEHEYEAKKWNSKYKSKIRKGYRDITDLKLGKTVLKDMTNNPDFDYFYETFSKYTKAFVAKNYIVEGCTPEQIKQAQQYIDLLNTVKTKEYVNKWLLELFKIIPRQMSDVNYYLVNSMKDVSKVIQREQEALDSMDSVNVTNTSNPLKELNISFKEIVCPDELRKKIESTNSTNHKIYKCYEVCNDVRRKKFDEWVSNSTDKTTELLFHGTRNPNIFSILKSDLLIRPSNAAVISGDAFGNSGIYHSSHAQKSLGYCGHDTDKIFFIQEVATSRKYTYNGWYEDGKDLPKSKMNYKDLREMGYDSLYVKASGRLQNSEYIVYNTDQTVVKYLIWFK